jgi:hypothetical protein
MSVYKIVAEMKFEVLAVVNVKITVFWDVMCSLAGRYQCFRGNYCLCLQDRGSTSDIS